MIAVAVTFGLQSEIAKETRKMQAKTSGGSIVTLTESGILLEHSGHFGINKNNKEIPFSAIRSIKFEKHLIRKFWTVITREGPFYLDADNDNSNFIGELKARIAPYQGGPIVIQQSTPQPVVQQITTQKEIVKIRCSHCRTLNPDTNPSCVHCGARL
jgi:hypothetical protein